MLRTLRLILLVAIAPMLLKCAGNGEPWKRGPEPHRDELGGHPGHTIKRSTGQPSRGGPRAGMPGRSTGGGPAGGSRGGPRN